MTISTVGSWLLHPVQERVVAEVGVDLALLERDEAVVRSATGCSSASGTCSSRMPIDDELVVTHTVFAGEVADVVDRASPSRTRNCWCAV